VSFSIKPRLIFPFRPKGVLAMAWQSVRPVQALWPFHVGPCRTERTSPSSTFPASFGTMGPMVTMVATMASCRSLQYMETDPHHCAFIQTIINKVSYKDLATQHDSLHCSCDCYTASLGQRADISKARRMPDSRMCLSSRPVSSSLTAFVKCSLENV